MRRATDKVTLLGSQPEDFRYSLVHASEMRRAPTPFYDRIYDYLSTAQRKGAYLGLIFIAIVCIVLILGTIHALAKTPDRGEEHSAIFEKQSEQDRRMDFNDKRIEDQNREIQSLKEEVSNMKGIGEGLGGLAILLQFFQIFNQSRVGNQVLRVVREKETNSNSAAGGMGP